MFTLKFKALLIKAVLKVFFRAILIYLLATIPALVAMPIMYLMSAGFALSFGWIAALIFLFLFYLLQRTRVGLSLKIMALYLSVTASVVFAFQMMELTGAQDHIWQSGAFLLFPAMAIISGWISLIISKQRISYLLSYTAATSNKPDGTDLIPPAENIF